MPSMNHPKEQHCRDHAEKSVMEQTNSQVNLLPNHQQHGYTDARLKRGNTSKILLTVLLLVCLSAFTASRYRQCTSSPDDAIIEPPTIALTRYAAATTQPLLEVFQVYPPVLTISSNETLELTDGSTNNSVAVASSSKPTCEETLVVYSFAYSYGHPFVGNYTPPTCSFKRVTWNLTVTSAGRQFDRLGIVYLGDIEVFRTSTAEPTATGIEWTYLKDMTSYLSLLDQSQKIIFDLGNLIDSTYTGAFNVTLSAAFFTESDSIAPADLILPISTRQSASDAASVSTVPPNIASNDITLPQNILRAVVTLSTTGQSDEEFWWSNVPSSYTETFPQTGELYGYTPFREVQLYIDGYLAGVAWPFPVIFTGGVVPGLWRPIVGIDAFDLKEDEVDITPWLPLVCDGNSHNFTIRISGLNDYANGTAELSETTDSYWLVTGKVFIWLDEANATTTGDLPTLHTPPPTFQVSSSVGTVGTGQNATNETLTYSVTAQRDLSISSTIRTSKGAQQANWQQTLYYSNYGNLTDAGNAQINKQSTTGVDISSSGYRKEFSYPLWAYTAYSTFMDNYTIQAIINRGKDVEIIGQPVFPTGLESFSPGHSNFQGAALSTSQNGSATYIANQTSLTSFSFGTTTQDMAFSGLEIGSSEDEEKFPTITGSTELFHRYVEAVNATIIEDEEILIDSAIHHVHLGLDSTRGFANSGVKEMIGRGPQGV